MHDKDESSLQTNVSDLLDEYELAVDLETKRFGPIGPQMQFPYPDLSA